MLGLGVGEIVLIGGALVLLFGARKIPHIAKGLGEGIRNFKGEVRSPSSEDESRRLDEPDAGPRRLDK